RPGASSRYGRAPGTGRARPGERRRLKSSCAAPCGPVYSGRPDATTPAQKKALGELIYKQALANISSVLSSAAGRDRPGGALWPAVAVLSERSGQYDATENRQVRADIHCPGSGRRGNGRRQEG